MAPAVTYTGKVQSACVACQTRCVAINSARTFWSTRKGQRGLSWAWGGAYPPWRSRPEPEGSTILTMADLTVRWRVQN